MVNKVELEIVVRTAIANALADLDKLGKKAGEAASRGKEVESSFSKFGSSIAGGLGIGAGISAFQLLERGVGKVVDVFKESVAAAVEAEESQKKLAQALRASGDSSANSLKDFTDYAEAVSLSTKATDDQVASLVALAANLGTPTAKIKEVVDAALDLSAAFGVDNATAVEAVSRALQGQGRQLASIVPAYKGLTDEQLRSKDILGELAARYGSFAENELKGFGGASTQAAKAYDELLETLGKTVTESETVSEGFKSITAGIQGFNNLLSGKGAGNLKTFFEELAVSINGVLPQLSGVSYLASKILSIVEMREEGKMNFAMRLARDAELAEKKLGGKPKQVQDIFNVLKTAPDTSNLFLVKEENPLLNQINDINDSLKVFKETTIDTKAVEDARAAYGKFYDDLGSKTKSQVILDIEAYNKRKELINEFSQKGIDTTQATIANDQLLRDSLLKTQEEIAEGNLTRTGLEYTQEEAKLLAIEELRKQYADKGIETDLEKQEYEALKNEEYFQVLEEGLGTEEALKRQAHIQELIRTNQLVEAKKQAAKDIKEAEEGGMFATKEYSKLTNQEKLRNLQQTLGTISTLMESSNKEAFALGKAAAITNATIQGILAVQTAIASPPGPPWSFALAAVVGAMAAVNVGKIASQSPPGYAMGGVVPGSSFTGDKVPIRVNSGERVLTAEQNENMEAIANSGAINNQVSAMLAQPIIIQIDGREIARAVRNQIDSGYRVVA